MKSLAILLLSSSFALAEDATPALPLSKAAKLAEDAIAEAKLPADCFLRSITLVQTGEAPAHYRASYKWTVREPLLVKGRPVSAKFDIIRITMDGKVSFEEEEFRMPRVSPKKK